jgi:hypothetical protein
MKKIHLISLCIIFPFLLFAQDNPPLTEDVTVEVQNTELEKRGKSQTLQVEITCNSSVAGQTMNLQLRGITGKYILVSAERDDQPLWLIQSETANENDVVLSWQTADDTQLRLFPGNWPAPYRLNLQIQASLTNLKDVVNITETQLDVLIPGAGGEELASPTGRGNKISLKNTRE